MKIKMTEQIQSIIIATQALKKWVYADSKARHYEIKDIYLKVYDYYKKLVTNSPLSATYACYEAVLSYPIEKTISTEMEDLGKFTFAY